jgi:hypothetical protein
MKTEYYLTALIICRQDLRALANKSVAIYDGEVEKRPCSGMGGKRKWRAMRS